jgi:hypothetical protein
MKERIMMMIVMIWSKKYNDQYYSFKEFRHFQCSRGLTKALAALAPDIATAGIPTRVIVNGSQQE